MDQTISIRNVQADKEQEENTIKAMNLLQGAEESSLVLQEEKNQPSFEALIHTENYEQGNQLEDDSEYQQNQLNNIFKQISVMNSVEEKRKLMREMTKKSITNMAEHSLEVGATFDIDKTYNQLAIEVNRLDLWEKDEDRVQNLVIGRYAIEDVVERVFKKEGRKKVYKGKPELWTPLDKEIPEDQHLRIKEAMRDYVEPNHYEQKYQTRKRRDRVIKPKEPETDYLNLPYSTNYLDEGEKLKF